MDDIYYNQCIVCKVKNCKYYRNRKCTLSEIEVNHQKNETFCASFEKKD